MNSVGDERLAVAENSDRSLEGDKAEVTEQAEGDSTQAAAEALPPRPGSGIRLQPLSIHESIVLRPMRAPACHLAEP